MSLDSFDDCDPKKNKVYILADFDKEISDLKLVMYGSIENLDNKYQFGFTLKRGNRLLKFGISLLNTIEKFENNYGFYVLSGWSIAGGNVSKSEDFLYLSSNYGRIN